MTYNVLMGTFNFVTVNLLIERFELSVYYYYYYTHSLIHSPPSPILASVLPINISTDHSSICQVPDGLPPKNGRVLLMCDFLQVGRPSSHSTNSVKVPK